MLRVGSRVLKKVRSRNSETQPTTAEKVKLGTELRQKYPLEMVLKVIEICRSTFYYQRNKTVSAETVELIEEIKALFHYHEGRYGYRRIALELKNKGFKINHKRVQRIMSELKLYGKYPKAKKRYNSYQGDLNGTCKNLLLEKVVDTKKNVTYYQRKFTTTQTNQIWSTDVSEFKIAAGKLYLSPILDLHSRDIISVNISTSPNFEQTMTMLNGALEQYENLEGLIFQSDQGWQYQMQQYREALQNRGIHQSMSRKGNCLDNSPMENFFSILKNEMFFGHEHEFETLEDLQLAIETYIEYYNTERISVKLKGLTPVQYRNQSLLT
ncbi:MAG: IS3 family transposase [Culicoidibacterales bacterium]